MAIFINRPALKRTALRSGTGTGSRVLGFCAIRAARCFTSKTPKSRNSRRLPSASSSTMPSRKSCTMSRTSVRRIPVKSAMRSTSSFFVVVPTVTPFSVRGEGPPSTRSATRQPRKCNFGERSVIVNRGNFYRGELAWMWRTWGKSARGLLAFNALAGSHHPDTPIGNHGAFDTPLPDRWIVPTGRRIRSAISSVQTTGKRGTIRPLQTPSRHRMGDHLRRRTATHSQAAKEEY